MAASYFPRSDAGLLVWLANLQATLPTQAKTLGLTSAETKDALDGAKLLATSIQTDEQKYAEWQAATAHTSELRTRTLAEIQRVIDRCKATPGYTAEISKALMAVPTLVSGKKVDDHKPVIRTAAHGGKVRLHWTRGSLDGIHVYSRKQGESAWVMLGHDARPPFDDTRPGAPGEIREYRAIGVINDEEVGLYSDIVSATVAA